MIGSTVVAINNTTHEVAEGNVVLAVAGITLLVVIGAFVVGEVWRRWSNRK